MTAYRQLEAIRLLHVDIHWLAGLACRSSRVVLLLDTRREKK